MIIKTFRVQLLPNHKQQTALFKTAGSARFAYNWVIEQEELEFQVNHQFIIEGDIRKQFTQLKKQSEYLWLNNVSNVALKQAIKDACNAYQNFFKKRAERPKFKSRKSKIAFQARQDHIQFTQNSVKLEKLICNIKSNRQKLNWVKLAEKGRIPVGCKYYNPRVTFDGLHWWISVGVEIPDSTEVPTNEGIGIDLGIKDLAICSDGYTYKNINKSSKVKKLKKKLRREQRKLSRKREADIIGYKKKGKGQAPIFDRPLSECKNYQKLKLKVLKLQQKLANIRQDYIQQTTSEIVNREPKFIVLEDLNVKGMMKNRHLAKAVQEQGFYEFYRQIEYKSAWHNIEFIVADRWFPSSKMCSCCGFIKKDLKLQDRLYVCPICGNSIDRDFQASLNLKNYETRYLVNNLKGGALLT